MKTILVQEYKDKIIHTKIHKVLTWFGQSCLHPIENNINILYNILYKKGILIKNWGHYPTISTLLLYQFIVLMKDLIKMISI